MPRPKRASPRAVSSKSALVWSGARSSRPTGHCRRDFGSPPGAVGANSPRRSGRRHPAAPRPSCRGARWDEQQRHPPHARCRRFLRAGRCRRFPARRRRPRRRSDRACSFPARHRQGLLRTRDGGRQGNPVAGDPVAGRVTAVALALGGTPALATDPVGLRGSAESRWRRTEVPTGAPPARALEPGAAPTAFGSSAGAARSAATAAARASAWRRTLCRPARARPASLSSAGPPIGCSRWSRIGSSRARTAAGAGSPRWVIGRHIRRRDRFCPIRPIPPRCSPPVRCRRMPSSGAMPSRRPKGTPGRSRCASCRWPAVGPERSGARRSQPVFCEAAPVGRSRR